MTAYVEILSESRKISVGKTSASQPIVIQFRLPVDEDGNLEVPSYTRASFLDATDDVLALETAYSLFPPGRWLPNSQGGDMFLVLDDLQVEQINNQDWWRATGTYKYDENTGVGGVRGDGFGQPGDKTLPFIKIGFSVGGGSKKITQSLEALERTQSFIGPAPRPGPCAEEIGNAIGQTEDGVEGADVPSNGLQLQITAYYFPQYVTFAFLRYLRDSIPTTNADNFLSFPPGECLLLGCDGSATVTDVVPITFTVDIKKNILDRPDPPFANLTCDGHSLLDYRYTKGFDECSEQLLMMPTFRIVHRVFEKTFFANLGFPTS